MRYILNNAGYIYNVSFGADIYCDLGNCRQYTGDIPEGYTTLEEWHDEEIERLNAWKVIDGNLVFDSNKASELEAICNEQAENNRHITKKELDTALADIGTGGEVIASNSDELKLLLPVQTLLGNVVIAKDSSSYEVKRIEVTSDRDITNTITIISSTPNLLPNEAVTQTINGLSLTVNEDKSISITGAATDSGTFVIAGSISNTTPILAFKENQPYYLTELPSGLTWNLYNYDGVDRELVYTGSGGVIELTENKPITHAEIVWASNGSIASNVKIYPMLNIGNTAINYEVHTDNKTIIDLSKNTLTPGEEIVIENGESTLGEIDRVINTYNPNSVIYAVEDVGIEIDYYKSDLYEKVTETGTLHLTNTYASTGAVNKLVINDITAGSIKYLIAGKTETETTKQYPIDLSNITGTVDVVIEKGKVSILQGNEVLKELDDIYINTYANDTYLHIDGEPNLVLDCEYMLKSTFTDIFCTIVEKNASFKVLQDMIQLEVTRASEKEGELSSSITIEADRITQEITRATEEEQSLSTRITAEAGKIEQIVTAVGDENEEVTPASIIQAINEDGSSIKISADKVNITSRAFPYIQNSNGTSKINTAYQPDDKDYGISYESLVHEFKGDFYQDGNNFMIAPNGKVLLYVFDNMVHIGSVDGEGIVSIEGSIIVNGEEFNGFKILKTEPQKVINSEYFYRFKNMIDNSSFEVFDGNTMIPLGWDNGVVVSSASMFGTYSLKLENGQTAKQTTKYQTDVTWVEGAYETKDLVLTFYHKYDPVTVKIYDVVNEAYLDLNVLTSDLSTKETTAAATFEFEENWNKYRCMVTFTPLETTKKIRIEFTCGTGTEGACYIDGPTLEPFVEGEFPSIYKDGRYSISAHQLINPPPADVDRFTPLEHLNIGNSISDSKGDLTYQELLRADGTLAIKREASNPDSQGNYQTIVETFYRKDGVTINYVDTYTYSYSTTGAILSRSKTTTEEVE